MSTTKRITVADVAAQVNALAGTVNTLAEIVRAWAAAPPAAAKPAAKVAKAKPATAPAASAPKRTIVCKLAGGEYRIATPFPNRAFIRALKDADAGAEWTGAEWLVSAKVATAVEAALVACWPGYTVRTGTGREVVLPVAKAA